MHLRIVLAASALALLATDAAKAADAVVEQPPVEIPIFTWTGGYLGIQGGYAWTKPDADTDFFGLDNVSSGMFGGYAGYNWQYGAWVFGAEGDFNGVWNDKTFAFAGPPPLIVDVGTDWLASIRARTGYAIDRTLLFVIGGVAFTKASADVTTAAGFTFSNDKTLTGWTLGAGAEYAFTDNWIGRAEYRYYDFGNVGTPTALGSVDFKSQTLTVRQRRSVIRAAGVRRAGSTAIISLAFLLQVSAARSETVEELEKQYNRDNMQQALQTREHYDLYGIHFESNQSALPSASAPLLDDIATALKHYPDWGLRIIGHSDATGDPNGNESLSVERANSIKAALVERGIGADRLQAAGAGEKRPIASNQTPEGRALNRRVELVRFTDSAEAKKLLKGMSDYLAGQKALSFSYDANLQVITNSEQKLGLASSGTVVVSRPDKVRTTRSGGFVDVETVFDGKTLFWARTPTSTPRSLSLARSIN